MGGIIDAIVGVVKKVFKAVVNVFTGFMGMFGMSFDTPDMGGGADYEVEAQGITVNKQSNVAGIPVVYGRRKVGGTRVFVGTTGDDNKYLYVCLAIAEGEINAFKKIHIMDEEQSITSFPIGSNVDVQNGSKFFVNGTARARFQFFTGTEDQSASSLLKEHPSWTDSHRLRGVAYVACRFEWVKADFDDDGNQTLYNPWQGIPTIQVEIEGKKVLPRTSYSSSDDTTTDSSTYEATTGSFAYSSNPADCLLDYLRNKRYGKGLNNNRIDFTAFRSAADTCNGSKNFGGSLGTAVFQECNMVVNTKETMFGNTKKLLQSCRGFLPYTNGKYQLKIEVGETTPGNLLEITDDMIIGAINITSEDKGSKYNACHVTYTNAEKNFESDTAIYEDSTYRTADGEPLLLTMGAPGITNRDRAMVYAEFMVERSRRQLQVSLTTTSETQNLVAGDLCTLTHRYERPGDATGTDRYDFLFKAATAESYSDPEKIFRVVSQKLNYDGTVELVLLEHQNNIFAVRQQQEDTDLSRYNHAVQIIVPPLLTKPKPPTPSPTVKQFTVQTALSMTNGVNRPQIRTANSSHSDVNATSYVYEVQDGSNTENFFVGAAYTGTNYYTLVNGNYIGYSATITVRIYSIYTNGQKNFIESHTITTPANASATASGGI